MKQTGTMQGDITVPISDGVIGEGPRRQWLQRALRSRVTYTVVFILFSLWLAFGTSDYGLYQATLIAIYAIVGLGQEWLFGRAAQISLGAAAFVAVGAYTTAWLSDVSWLPFPLPILVSAAAGAVVGVLIGIPGLRFSGLYLMLTTLALYYIVVFAAQEFQGTSTHMAGFAVTPGAWGGTVITQGRNLFIVCAVVLGLTMLGLDGIYRSAPGRAWKALRQNEEGAAVLGIATTRWKLIAFVGSSAITAAAGSLYAYASGLIDYNSFSLEFSLTLLVMVFIGGAGRMLGPVIGAALVMELPGWVKQVSNAFSGMPSVQTWIANQESFLELAIYGLLFLVIILYEREGIVGLVLRIWRLLVGLSRRMPIG